MEITKSRLNGALLLRRCIFCIARLKNKMATRIPIEDLQRRYADGI